MKNLFKIITVQLLLISVVASGYAQQQSEQQSAPVQKDDKRSLTVMTTDTPGVNIEKKDLLNEIFTPVGDVMFWLVKTPSDVLGGACQGCLNAFDGTMKFLLTPFGFKQEPSEKRVFLS